MKYLYFFAAALIILTAGVVMARARGGTDVFVSQLREMQAFQRSEARDGKPESDALDFEIGVQVTAIIQSGGTLSHQDLSDAVRGLEHVRADTHDPDIMNSVDNNIRVIQSTMLKK